MKLKEKQKPLELLKTIFSAKKMEEKQRFSTQKRHFSNITTCPSEPSIRTWP